MSEKFICGGIIDLSKRKPDCEILCPHCNGILHCITTDTIKIPVNKCKCQKAMDNIRNFIREKDLEAEYYHWRIKNKK